LTIKRLSCQLFISISNFLVYSSFSRKFLLKKIKSTFTTNKIINKIKKSFIAACKENLKLVFFSHLELNLNSRLLKDGFILLFLLLHNAYLLRIFIFFLTSLKKKEEEEVSK
jgi:hypothetical protein